VISHGQILAVFFNANDSERRDGARFYSDALDFCRENVPGGITVPTMAAVVAALSPNNKWERNKLDAFNLARAYSIGGRDACDAVKVATYNANKHKAIRILSGENPVNVLGGLKVNAFYRCILGCQDSVCVDGHAYAIWQGVRIPTTKTPTITPKVYAAIAADYAMASRQISQILGQYYSPAQIQAITWLAWRRMMREAD